MGEIMEVAEQAWSGSTGGRHIWRAVNRLEEVAPGTWFYSGFANMTVFDTGDGLVIADPGARNNAREKYEAVRAVSDRPLHSAVYTHGHMDHVWGVEHYAAEARERGWPPPRVVAHELVGPRFDRYRKTAGWNGVINQRQFRGGAGSPSWPTDYWYPDVTYADRLALTVGGLRVELRHARGETDDATWLFVPDRGVLCTGDLFVWVAPNCGNPQKVQRYAGEWAVALREMAARDATLLLPGHGPPIAGEARVRLALEETAEYLESLEEQTLALMNRGASLDEVLERVRPPERLVGRPYLQPVYDEPEFIVRNIWRLYGGWYDGQPAHLKPASERAQAEEIARLAGGTSRLAERALELAAAGDDRLACHLVDWAHLAAPEDAEIRKVRGQIYRERARREASTMAVGLFNTAAREMGESLGEGPTFSAQEATPRSSPEGS
jgi:alkyl sulfatase BDS1-like metallo-beta-lactamase superfamily hydrolase